jgi:hypothetical protein
MHTARAEEEGEGRAAAGGRPLASGFKGGAVGVRSSCRALDACAGTNAARNAAHLRPRDEAHH